VVIAVQVENIRRNVAHYRLVITDEGERFLLAKPYFDRQPDETLVLRNVPPAKEAMAPDALPEGERDLVDQGGRLLWLRQNRQRDGRTGESAGPARDALPAVARV
jgi:hypothetical protein